MTNEKRLLQFFLENAAGQATIKKLSNALIECAFPGEDSILLSFHKGQAEIKSEGKADFRLSFGNKALLAILESDSRDVGDFGVAFFKSLVQNDESLRINAKIFSGFFNLTRKGYLSLIPMGGPKVLKYLASKGVIGPLGIKKAINFLRG